MEVPKVNPWLRQYLRTDAARGDFALYLEIASSNGRYRGYAKPILKDVEFLSLDEPAEPVKHPLKGLWKAALQLAAEMFENQPRQQVAAKIPFSGTVARKRTDVVAALASVLRNAFVAAFTRSIEGSISLKDVEDAPPT